MLRFKKEGRCQITDLKNTNKQTKTKAKKEQNKPKASRRKEIKKLGAEINEIEEKLIEKSNEKLIP